MYFEGIPLYIVDFCSTSNFNICIIQSKTKKLIYTPMRLKILEMIKMLKNRKWNKNGLLNRLMCGGFILGSLLMLFVAALFTIGYVEASDITPTVVGPQGKPYGYDCTIYYPFEVYTTSTVLIRLDGIPVSVFLGQHLIFEDNEGIESGEIQLKQKDHVVFQSNKRGELQLPSSAIAGTYIATGEYEDCIPTEICINKPYLHLDIVDPKTETSLKSVTAGDSIKLKIDTNLDDKDGVVLRVWLPGFSYTHFDYPGFREFLDKPGHGIPSLRKKYLRMKENYGALKIGCCYNVRSICDLMISTQDMKLGIYEFSVVTNPSHAHGLDLSSNEKTLKVGTKTEYMTEAEPTLSHVLPTKKQSTPIPAEKQPGFEAIFALAGLLAVVYLLRRRGKDNKK